MAPAVREQVLKLLGGDSDSDEDILEYIITCLEDDSFECGEDGEGVVDAIGMMLVLASSCAVFYRFPDWASY